MPVHDSNFSPSFLSPAPPRIPWNKGKLVGATSVPPVLLVQAEPYFINRRE
jgi:hypothetical protein